MTDSIQISHLILVLIPVCVCVCVHLILYSLIVYVDLCIHHHSKDTKYDDRSLLMSAQYDNQWSGVKWMEELFFFLH